MYDWLIGPFVEFEFMRRALAGTTALALGAGPIGVFLMLRRMSLVGDAMAHAILPGAAVGFLVSGLNLFAMTTGGLIAGFTVALLAGLVATVEYLDDVGWEYIQAHERTLGQVFLDGLPDGCREGQRNHGSQHEGGCRGPGRGGGGEAHAEQPK